jgi:hypothetical protein
MIPDAMCQNPAPAKIPLCSRGLAPKSLLAEHSSAKAISHFQDMAVFNRVNRDSELSRQLLH